MIFSFIRLGTETGFQPLMPLQESADLLHEEQVGDALSTLNESGQDFVQFRSLSLD